MGKNMNDGEPKTRKDKKGRKNRGEKYGTVYSSRHIRETEKRIGVKVG